MIISGFQSLLQAARQQPEPQQMLFVFVRTELPDDATPADRARFEKGQGGALTPIMMVDKRPADLPSFAELVEESRQMGEAWDLVFVGCLSGVDGRPPAPEEIDKGLENMVKHIQAGVVGQLLAYLPSGEQVNLRGPAPG